MARTSKAALLAGYRSGLEEVVAKQLAAASIDAQYEPLRFTYEPLRKTKTYTPDFILPNGIVIETKGRFVSADRQKHKALLAQYPELDIRFVFSNPKAKLSKTSATTYGDWCTKLGIPHAHRTIPEAWLAEPVCSRRLAAIEKAKK